MDTTNIKRNKKIRNDLTNKRFGKLVCIKPTGNFIHAAREWLCQCDCGQKHKATANHLVCGGVKSCGCTQYRKNQNHSRWKGFGEISGRYLSDLQRGAKSRNLDFLVSIEDLWELFLKQERLCALSKVPLKFADCIKNKMEGQTASLDRINPAVGYVKGNIQWVHKTINFMKQDLTEVEFIEWCKKIVDHNSNPV